MTRARIAAALALVTVSFAACAARTGPSPARRASISPVVLPASPRDALAVIARRALSEFDRAAAMAIVRTADRGFRTRGNEAYVATLAAVQEHLTHAGFRAVGPADAAGAGPAESMRPEILESDAPIWDARAGLIEVVAPVIERLQRFDTHDDTQRTMLVAYTSPGDVTAELVEWTPGTRVPRQVLQGRIVLTNARPSQAGAALARAGAVAVVSSHTEAFNHVERFPDTIRYEMFDGEAPPSVPMFNASPRTAARLRALLHAGPVRLHVQSDCVLRRGRTETLVARIEGAHRDASPIVVVAHADEPGANDNGSGVGTLAEAAALYARWITTGSIPRPEHPIVFLFGMEIEMSRRWLQFHSAPRPVFAVSVDMAGEPASMSSMLVERTPDPGAVRVRPPDHHTAWGTGSVRRAWVHGTFLNALAIGAVHSVGWTREVGDHPFEGGSDHVPFLERFVPALLLWHFPDDAYHTNRDRFARVDADEMAGVAAALLAMLRVGAGGRDDDVLAMIALNESYARDRMAVEAVQSTAAIPPTSAPPDMRAGARVREHEHLNAWLQWFDEALQSCATLADAPSPTVLRAIAEARDRVRVLGVSIHSAL